MVVTHRHTVTFTPNDLFAREQADITKATIQNAGIKVKEVETTTGITLAWTETIFANRSEE